MNRRYRDIKKVLKKFLSNLLAGLILAAHSVIWYVIFTYWGEW